MTISERIFELLKEKKMSQKMFSEATGISQSSISDWKKKKTNPVSDKILIICEVLEVSPEELLSGTENNGKRSNPSEYLVLDKASELGRFVIGIQNLDQSKRDRLMGYYAALVNPEA